MTSFYVALVIGFAGAVLLAASAVLQRRRTNARRSAVVDWRRLRADVAALLERGEEVKAVKTYRQRTGVGLLEATAFVEDFARDSRL